MKQGCRSTCGCNSGPHRHSGSRKTFMGRWEKISHLTMKAMMFCVFWHKTTLPEICRYHEKWKIVELTPWKHTMSFRNLNSAYKTQKAHQKGGSIGQNTTQPLNLRKNFYFCLVRLLQDKNGRFNATKLYRNMYRDTHHYPTNLSYSYM